MGFPGGASGKEPACQCSRCRRHRFDPWVRKIPCRRKWQPTPIFLPGESHGQRSLAKSRTWLKQLSRHARTIIAFAVIHNSAWSPRTLTYVAKYQTIYVCINLLIYCCSVVQSSSTLCDLMDCSTPDFPVLHHLPELAQTHAHRVGDAIQPSRPLSSPSPPAFNLSQHQGLF